MVDAAIVDEAVNHSHHLSKLDTILVQLYEILFVRKCTEYTEAVKVSDPLLKPVTILTVPPWPEA